MRFILPATSFLTAFGLAMRISSPEWLHDDLDAAVLFRLERLVELRPFLKRGAVRDDKGWINLTLFDPLHQLWHVMLNRRLGHSECKAPIDRAPHRNIVQHAAVDADDRDRAEVAATLNGLAQDVRPVGAHEGCYFDTVHDRIRARLGFGLRADRIDAGIGASAIRQFLDAVVNVFFHEIERCGTRSLRQSQALRHRVYRNHMLSAEQKRAFDRELADRAATPNRDSLAALQIAEV